MALRRVLSDLTKIKLIKSYVGNTLLSEAPFTHVFRLNGNVEVSNADGDTFTIRPPAIADLSVEVYQDDMVNLVAVKFAKTGVLIWMYFDFDAKLSGVKVHISGSLTTATQLRIPLTAATKFLRGKSFWVGVQNSETGIIERGVGFDWSDIVSAVAWDNANGHLTIDVPASFDLDPTTVTTAAGAGTYYNTQKKVCRTSDGTIHALIRRTGYVTHYYSYDDGSNWSSSDVWSTARSCCIDRDSGDNLVAAVAENSYVYFKKATVTKGTPWTWSWSSEKQVSAGTNYYPDIIVDGNDYYHIVWERTSSSAVWARCVDGTGSSWILTDLTGLGGYFMPSVVKDSVNNLYVFGGKTDCTDLGKGVRITYSSGPSWSVGTTFSVTGANSYPVVPHILSDDTLVIVYCNSSVNLYFRKADGASQVQNWLTAVSIKNAIDQQYSCSVMVINNNTLRAYYCDGNVLCYKESTDGGGTFGSEIQVYVTGANKHVNVAKQAVGGKISYVWANDTTVVVYHDFVVTQIVKEVVDSLGLGEAVLRGWALSVSDSVGLADSPFKGWAPGIADSVSLSDVASRDGVFQVLDLFRLTDSCLRGKVFTVSDSLGLVDVVSVLVGVREVLDSIGLADNVFSGKALIILDGVNLSASVGAGKGLVLADQVWVSDGVFVGKISFVADGVSLVEVVERGLGGVVKTRVFLLIGDLAIQLTG